MGVFTIQTPDGRTIDIEAADQNAAIAGARDWVSKNPKQPINAVQETLAPVQGFNEGIDALLNLPNQAVNLGAQGVNYAARKFGYSAPFSDQPIPDLQLATRFNPGGNMAYDISGNKIPAYEPETAYGRYGRTIGQIAGSSVVPEAALMAKAGQILPQSARTLAAIRGTAKPVAEAAKEPVAALKSAMVPTVGAGVGTQAAKDMDLGPIGELAGGLVGGFAAPLAWGPLARTGGGLRNAVKFANDQAKAANNPDQAAVDTLAKALVNTKTTPEEIRGQVLQGPSGEPLLSKELQGRGITEEHLADMIGRRLQGEPATSIAKDYPGQIAPGTIDAYVTRYQQNNPTPRNIMDIVTELRGPGGAQPLLRRGRSAFGIIGDESADTAQALYNRQMEQPGRVAGIIQQSSINGRNLEEEAQRLATTARQEETAAYNKAMASAQPVNIQPVIDEARAKFPMEGGDVSERMNKAIDLFYKGGMVEGRKDTLRYSKALKPVDDVPTYLRRRRELDQMIASSYEGGRPSPLTRELTQFRQSLNAAARSNNADLAAADAKFAGNRSIEALIEQGQQLGKTMTPKTRQAMRDFQKLTPTQQEIIRTSFEDKMANRALDKQEGAAAANQYSTPNFSKIIEAFYPQSAGKDVYQRGQRILRSLNQEAIGTGTTNFVTGRGNSPTAPWTADIQSRLQAAQAAADLATGRWTKLIGNFSDWLARKIGQNAAKAELNILAETDPAKVLNYANRLDQAYKSTALQDQLLSEIRQARIARPLRRDTGIGVGTISARDTERH